MLDQAGIMMAQGKPMACERICGVNDNMSKSHYHDYFELYYLESGERYHMIQDQLYLLKPGEFILFSPYMMHHSFGEENMPFKRLLVYFQMDEINSPNLLAALERGTGVYQPDEEVRRIIYKMMQALLKEQNQPLAFSCDYMHSLLNLLLLTIIRQTQGFVKPEAGNRISNVIHYIHNHYYEDINLEHLAQVFYISPYYLCREFKRITNSTIVQYINTTRIMNAQRKFMETDKNITEISKETGFSNITHFNRVFKSVTGMAPSVYRKGVRNGNEIGGKREGNMEEGKGWGNLD